MFTSKRGSELPADVYRMSNSGFPVCSRKKTMAFSANLLHPGSLLSSLVNKNRQQTILAEIHLVVIKTCF